MIDVISTVGLVKTEFIPRGLFYTILNTFHFLNKLFGYEVGTVIA